MATARITIEAHGYRWRVHGDQRGKHWRSHLIELLGNERLDVPLNRELRWELRRAVAKFLALQVEDVKPIPTDLILA